MDEQDPILNQETRPYILVTLNDETGGVEWEFDGFTPYEVIGLAKAMTSALLDRIRQNRKE